MAGIEPKLGQLLLSVAGIECVPPSSHFAALFAETVVEDTVFIWRGSAFSHRENWAIKIISLTSE